MTKSYKKWREPCVLFLEECIAGKAITAILRDAGYSVEIFHDHFKNPDGSKREGVSDPEIIKFSGTRAMVLVTMDKDMRRRWLAEIKDYRAMVVATAHCGKAGVPHDAWGRALVAAKRKIEQRFKKNDRPWWVQIDQTGRLTTERLDGKPKSQKPKEKRGKKSFLVQRG